VRRPFILAIALAFLLLAACRQQPITRTDITITVSVNPSPTVVGPSTMTVALAGPDGKAIDGATLNIRGDMNHPGMQPVLANTSQSTNGQYQVPFTWTMSGDWIITVSATLPDGNNAQGTFPLTVGNP
jgi:hypothetical protein